MKYLKVEGHDGLIRDPNTNSIINTNMTEYKEYLSRKKIREGENKKMETLETDVANIRNDLDEIKYLLRSIINESR